MTSVHRCVKRSESGSDACGISVSPIGGRMSELRPPGEDTCSESSDDESQLVGLIGGMEELSVVHAAQ